MPFFARALLVPFAALLAALSFAADAADDAAPLRPALEAARQDAAVPLALAVDCNTDSGHRSVQLYPSGVLAWNNERQARIGPTERAALLDALLEADFASFEDSYGGKPRAERTGAPVMVLCRIEVSADEVTKSSYQDVNGERSERFLALAGRLLDILAERGAGGVAAASLADGLDKLTSGELAVEALALQLMRLPANRRGAGVILEVAAGEVSSRAYEPGVAIGEVSPRPLAHEEIQSLVAALNAATVSELPARTTAPDIYQLRVQVLQHRLSVHARPPGDGQQADPEGARLLRLADTLLTLFPVR